MGVHISYVLFEMPLRESISSPVKSQGGLLYCRKGCFFIHSAETLRDHTPSPSWGNCSNEVVQLYKHCSLSEATVLNRDKLKTVPPPYWCIFNLCNPVCSGLHHPLSPVINGLAPARSKEKEPKEADAMGFILSWRQQTHSVVSVLTAGFWLWNMMHVEFNDFLCPSGEFTAFQCHFLLSSEW